MAYRYDTDLEFLKKCENEDLEELFNLLVYDPKDGGNRFTETLSISDEYKMYGHDYKKYWQRIAEELQLYGGNTLVNNFFRFGTGVTYGEIVKDVAKVMKVNFSYGDSTLDIENKIFEKNIEDLFEKMTPEEIKEFLNEISEDDIQLKEIIKNYSSKNFPWKKIGLSIVREALKRSGFLPYKLSVVIANIIWKNLFGKGLSFAANKTLTKVLGRVLGGPLALILNAWIIVDIASQATRVTIPAVILIGTLRKKVMCKE